MKKQIDKKDMKPKPLKTDEWEPICKRVNKQYKEELTHLNYVVEIPDIHAKRTVQQKVVEFMILKLFSK